MTCAPCLVLSEIPSVTNCYDLDEVQSSVRKCQGSSVLTLNILQGIWLFKTRFISNSAWSSLFSQVLLSHLLIHSDPLLHNPSSLRLMPPHVHMVNWQCWFGLFRILQLWKKFTLWADRGKNKRQFAVQYGSRLEIVGKKSGIKSCSCKSARLVHLKTSGSDFLFFGVYFVLHVIL